MDRLHALKCALVGGASIFVLARPVLAREFDVPRGDLAKALDIYTEQAGVQLIYSDDAVRGRRTKGAKGDYTELAALNQVLTGTGFRAQETDSTAIGVVPQAAPAPVRMAQATRNRPTPAPSAPVETVTVTAERKREDIQTVPIAVTALSQRQLTERQIAGGPDLIKEVPNLTFSKTNFTGYNIQIRGIGTQAISVTTDPAVAVAFNGIPFIRNHFFEQEFYDVDNLEVLRGPQGTLWGRNATAGVVNVTSAKPTDEFDMVASADFGNYNNRRFEGMINLPIAGDKLDLRFAGEWTKRDGYSTNQLTGSPIDGRDLWSGRASLRWRPTTDLDVDLVWEHFSEDDDRMRTAKQLCHTDTPPTSINGVPVRAGGFSSAGGGPVLNLSADYLSQGCKPSSLYAPDAFQVPYGFSLPYAVALGAAGGANDTLNPYASTTQSRNLRVIESAINPKYKAKNDTLELNTDYKLTPELTITSQTGFNQDYLSSTEDYNRFNTAPGIFEGLFGPDGSMKTSHYLRPDPAAGTGGIPADALIFCDPQLGCSDRLVAQDLSNEHAWQLSQEFRLASNFSGPLNFSLGGNYLHYETEENYYVFVNALSRYSVAADQFGNSTTLDNSDCLQQSLFNGGYQNSNPKLGGGEPLQDCVYIDTNPLGRLNNKGHNYFLSQNPYTLNSYAAFGEAYYQITRDLKLTGGLRWTEDRKHFVDVPSEVLAQEYGYPVTGIVDQQWDQLTGRAAVNWTPKLDFTDQTLVYGSYARGYKAGGANPPGAIFKEFGLGDVAQPSHPLTFRPEFIDAYELGTKNTLLDGTLTINANVFYYAYKDYQISEIVDRTSINLNFNATVKGAEVETTWEPAPGLKFSFAGGYEDATLNNGDRAIDLMDRTAGMPGWMVVKPFPTQASNCILPTYVVQALLEESQSSFSYTPFACGVAYGQNRDPVTVEPFVANPSGIAGFDPSNPSSPICSLRVGQVCSLPIPVGYPGFDPSNPAINDGAGFAKNLSGNQLPNAPHFTASFTAEYTMPVWTNWAATLHGDFYWQASSFARVFNDKPYDQIHGYENLNLALILNSADGWQVMGYLKNVFNTTAITGDFLNSDDSGLTTNVFLTDPRLFGVRITKDFGSGGEGGYGVPEFFTDLFSHTDGARPTLWVELGGQAEHILGQGEPFAPAFLAANPTSSVLWNGTSPIQAQDPPKFSFGEEAKFSFQPEDSNWVISAALRFGRSSNFKEVDHQTNGVFYLTYKYGVPKPGQQLRGIDNFSDTQAHHKESHAILDFTAGKDVGLGMFGLDGSSVLSGGVRIAQFTSNASFDIRARPHLQFYNLALDQFGYPGVSFHFPYFHTYHATGQASRSFRGVGPTLSWNGSVPVVGALKDGEATFDWGLNAAVLFGRQRARVRHHESGHYVTKFRDFLGGGYYTAYDNPVGGHDATRSVTVPNLGGFAGVSYRVENAKISLGYRADFFFGAIDGGIDKPKSETLGFTGPFANISIGFGG